MTTVDPTLFAAACLLFAGLCLATLGVMFAVWLTERGRNRQNAALTVALRDLRAITTERDRLRGQLALARRQLHIDTPTQHLPAVTTAKVPSTDLVQAFERGAARVLARRSS